MKSKNATNNSTLEPTTTIGLMGAQKSKRHSQKRQAWPPEDVTKGRSRYIFREKVRSKTGPFEVTVTKEAVYL